MTLKNVSFSRPINNIGREAKEAELHPTGLWVMVKTKKGTTRMVPHHLVIFGDVVETHGTIQAGQAPGASRGKAKASATEPGA